MDDPPGRLVHVPAEALTEGTAQTPGMLRRAAITGEAAGSRSIWMGSTTVAAGAASGRHHHGASETAIYVVAGAPVFSYWEGDREVRLQTKAGDFVYVPPFVPHVESNPSAQDAVVVLARTTQEAIVVNL